MTGSRDPQSFESGLCVCVCVKILRDPTDSGVPFGLTLNKHQKDALQKRKRFGTCVTWAISLKSTSGKDLKNCDRGVSTMAHRWQR